MSESCQRALVETDVASMDGDVSTRSRRESSASFDADCDSDRPLFELLAAGDPDAMRTLCAVHGPRVLSYLVGQLGDRALAEDVTQEVMLAAWHGASRFRGDCRVVTWLLAIAHNKAITARNRRNGHEAIVDPDTIGASASHTPGTTSTDTRIDLRAALRVLSRDQRATLDLVFFHGLSVDETSIVLGVAPGTVKSRLHRARAVLHDHLGASYERGL